MTDPVVAEAISRSQQATMTPQIAVSSGAGKAYQAVAQSAALAIQDAADSLRNINTIAVTTMGVAFAQYLDTQDAGYLEVINQAQKLMAEAVENFSSVGEAAAVMLKNFPSG